MAETILFEHPLNEKCRTWLRMSHLFEQLEFHLPHVEEWHSRAAMAALLDIAIVLARADIKSELLKELERYRSSFSKMADSPGVDTERLHSVLEELKRTCGGVQAVKGQLGQALRSNEFLSGIVQRSSIAGGGFASLLRRLAAPGRDAGRDSGRERRGRRRRPEPPGPESRSSARC